MSYRQRRSRKNTGSSIFESLNSPRKPFLDEYRAYHCIKLVFIYFFLIIPIHMMLMTCIAILAVDFTVFPRKFAKTETYGISMDMGVGCVVLSGALVSRQARAQPQEETRRANNKNNRRLFFAWGAIKSSLPLVILGLARIILTKSTNYQEHVSEYGVHWNFFFTLGSVALFTALINAPIRWSAFMGLVIACVYQFALSNGLREFIIHHPRENFISQNKEGLCSIFGYLSIYLIGTQLGNFLFSPRVGLRDWTRATITLILWTIISFALGHLSEVYIESTSRRMANLTYVLFTVAYTLFTLTSCLVVSLMFYNSPSTILSAINKNQLFFFLLGNIVTGLINVSMYTLYTPPATAMAVLFSYIFGLCFVGLILDKKNIVLRL